MLDSIPNARSQASWATVVEAKKLWAPFTTKKDDGTVKSYFSLIGVKILMADGSKWTFHLKHKTWTKTEPGLPLRYKSLSLVTSTDGKVEVGPPRITRYGQERQLLKELGHCPALLCSLRQGYREAMAS